MPRLDPGDPASAAPWIEDVGVVVGRFARMSAELAARSYDAERADAGLRPTFRTPLADPPPTEQVEASMRWAAHDVWQPSDAPAAYAQPQETYSSQLAARLMAQVQSRTEAAASKLVLDTGRRTTVGAVQRDRQARGWYRAADLGACAFCRLLSSRGAVYKDRGTAGGDANSQFTGAGQFKFHDHCACVAMPVMAGDAFALSAEAAYWDDVYRRYAQGYSGDQLRRYRIALRLLDEGITPTDQDFAA